MKRKKEILNSNKKENNNSIFFLNTILRENTTMKEKYNLHWVETDHPELSMETEEDVFKFQDLGVETDVTLLEVIGRLISLEVNPIVNEKYRSYNILRMTIEEIKELYEFDYDFFDNIVLVEGYLLENQLETIRM